jgi:hypothetical protein
MKRRLLANLQLMLVTAAHVLKNNGIVISDYQLDRQSYCLWHLDGEFDDYRYPRQPAQERNRTALSGLINMPW